MNANNTPTDAPPLNFQAAILQEQMRLLYRHTIPLLLVNLAVGSALVFSLWPVANQTLLLAWAAFLLLLSAVRYLLYRGYTHRSLALSMRGYACIMLLVCALQGVVWGSTGILFFDTGVLEHQLLVLFVLAGMGAGSVPHTLINVATS